MRIICGLEFRSLDFTPEEIFPDGVPEDFTTEQVKQEIRDHLDEYFSIEDGDVWVFIYDETKPKVLRKSTGKAP